MEANKKQELKKELFSYAKTFGAALLIVFAIKFLGFNTVQIDGQSMEPTLEHGQRVIISNLGYQPQVGDIVIFEAPHVKELYVKRIIATEGQTVDINQEKGEIYIDNQLLVDDFVTTEMKIHPTIGLPYKVPADSYFVMGDNRNNSDDSRNGNIAAIPRENIKGKIIFRFWPFDKLGSVK